jgi:hypothetical protein
LDNDEAFVLTVCSIVAVLAAGWWYITLWRLKRFARQKRTILLLAFTPIFCTAFLAEILINYSDPLVRAAPEYIILFIAAGVSLLGITAVAMPYWMGISVRDDALERNNGAAAMVACGAMFGVTLTFAGANIGDGPTIWTTLEPAFFALAGLALMWGLHAITSGMPEAVAVDRDPATAIRTTGMQLATALLLGRAVAGDWISQDATIRDFIHMGWPALVLMGAAIVIDRIQLRRAWVIRRHLRPSIVIAAAYLLIAVVLIELIAGPLERPK